MPDYQICVRCVMDTTDKHIIIDENGICNHCYNYDKNVTPKLLKKSEKIILLEEIIAKIKSDGVGKKYDCVVGLSGGMDSSYVMYVVKKYGLRTLIVHFDNGWDSELAIKNIENIIDKTGFDYYNHVVDWEEFKDLQLSYLKASVVDIEIPTDMGIFSLIPKIALKNDVKYILSGSNIETEVTMGKEWNYKKLDRSNLEAIHKKFGNKPLKTFPYLSPLQRLYIFAYKKIKNINILEYEECNYKIIKDILSKEFGWKDYGVKHGESIFTKFYQSYILPNKFGFDKRRAQLSDLINSKQITRKEAIIQLSKPVYLTPDDELREYEYFINKIGLSTSQFDSIMATPIKSHYDYPFNQPDGPLLDRFFVKILMFLRPFYRYIKEVFYKK